MWVGVGVWRSVICMFRVQSSDKLWATIQVHWKALSPTKCACAGVLGVETPCMSSYYSRQVWDSSQSKGSQQHQPLIRVYSVWMSLPFCGGIIHGCGNKAVSYWSTKWHWWLPPFILVSKNRSKCIKPPFLRKQIPFFGSFPSFLFRTDIEHVYTQDYESHPTQNTLC